MATIRVGIGGWNFPPWRGRFYPKGLPRAQELAYAGSRLSSIEINATFYRHQSANTFAAWREATPEHFVFAVKAHRASTSAKDFAGADAAIARFLESGIAELGPKLGPILWQFPPNRRFDPDTAETFLAALPKTLDGRTLRHAIEARHASFDNPAWTALLRRYQAAAVIVESGKQSLRGDITGGFVYARLQQNVAAAQEGYASDALDRWATRFAAWANGDAVDDVPLTDTAKAAELKPLPCFVYFIGGDKERAPDSACALIRRFKT